MTRHFVCSVTLLVALGSLLCGHVLAQSDWTELTGAPTVGRYNDVYFVTPETGWVVNGDGEIYRTTDSGETWYLQFRKASAHFRSVGFISKTRGFAGNVGVGEFGTTDANPLYETFDGGQTWSPKPDWHGRTPTGLCGMQVVDDSVVVAVGRVRGPAFFARTTDGGSIWRSKDMSSHAAGLIDVFFTHPDSGFAVGLTDANHDRSSCIVLRTTDGGQSWQHRFTSTRTGEWCWKLSFPSRKVGYASIQRNSESPIYILKTADGGETWTEKLFSPAYYFVQGIGFIDEEHGWIGGNSNLPVMETRDGGESWIPEQIRPRLNRFRFLGDSLGYAVGRQVHKLDRRVSAAVEAPPGENHSLSRVSAFPNPMRDHTRITYSLLAPVAVDLTIVDLLGRTVFTEQIVESIAGAGSLVWNGRTSAGSTVPSGTYLYTVRAGNERAVGTLFLMR